MQTIRRPTLFLPPVKRDTIPVFKLTVTDDKGGSDSGVTAVKVAGKTQTTSGSSTDQEVNNPESGSQTPDTNGVIGFNNNSTNS